MRGVILRDVITSSPYIMCAPNTLCIICCCAPSDINSLVYFASEKKPFGPDMYYFTECDLLYTEIPFY